MTAQRFAYTPLPPFPPLELAFAWTDVPQANIRVLLGQINFFQHFKVTFTAYEQHFELSLKV